MVRPAVRLALMALAAFLLPACGKETETITIYQAQAPAALPGATGSGSIGSFGGAVVPGVVFLSDRNQVGVFELWAADLGGTVLVNLSGPLAPGGDVTSILWSPGRSHVAFLADKELDEVKSLWIVPAAGGTPVKVFEIPFGGSLVDMRWSPDSSRLLFLVDLGTTAYEAHTVRADGSGPVNLTSTLTFADQFGLVLEPFSPDSVRVAMAVGDGVTGRRLYTFRSDGSAAPVAVTGSFPLAGGVGDHLWAPDGSRLAYVAEDADRSLYTTLPTSAASVVKISEDPTPAYLNGISTFAWAPDSTRVAYLTDGASGLYELYSAPAAAAGGSVKINAAPPPSSQVSGFAWAPDSSRVAYKLTGTTYTTLHTTLPASSASVVDIAPAPAQGSGVRSFEWASTSSRLLFEAIFVNTGEPRIYTAPPATASSFIAASGVSLSGSPLPMFALWGPDGTRLAYLVDEDQSGFLELFTAPAAASGSSVNVSGPAAAGFMPRAYRWTTDGSRLVYATTPGTIFDPATALFATSPVSGGPVRVSGPLLPMRTIATFQVR